VAAFSRRRIAPEVLCEPPSMRTEGAGNAGCAVHPRPRVQKKAHALATTGTPQSTGIPCAMVLRLISCSPRGPGSFAPVIPEKLASQELSASVGAPGPHAFAVRFSIARLATPLRPPHPAPNVRDDREAPLLWERDAGKNTHFPIFRKRNICAWRTDDSNQLESAHKIRFYAHAIFCPRRRSIAATSSKIQTESPDDGQISCGRAGKRSRSPQAMGRARAQLRPDQS
jgi:hypothetical protein